MKAVLAGEDSKVGAEKADSAADAIAALSVKPEDGETAVEAKEEVA